MNIKGTQLLKQLMVLKLVDPTFWNEIKDIRTEDINSNITFKIDTHEI
jgi:hypothetical protein